METLFQRFRYLFLEYRIWSIRLGYVIVTVMQAEYMLGLRARQSREGIVMSPRSESASDRCVQTAPM